MAHESARHTYIPEPVHGFTIWPEDLPKLDHPIIIRSENLTRDHVDWLSAYLDDQQKMTEIRVYQSAFNREVYHSNLLGFVRGLRYHKFVGESEEGIEIRDTYHVYFWEPPGDSQDEEKKASPGNETRD